MAFATKKDALNWLKYHLKSTKYGRFYDPINGIEVYPIKTKDGYWKIEPHNDEWLNEIEQISPAGGGAHNTGN